MVLASGEDVEPYLLGLECDLCNGADTLRLRGGVTRGGVLGDVADAKDAELHACLLSVT